MGEHHEYEDATKDSYANDTYINASLEKNGNYTISCEVVSVIPKETVKEVMGGLKCGSKEGTQHQLHMPTLHGMLLNNVNILLNEAPLKGDSEDPVALFKEACKNEEENINVLFNTLNDAMKELAEE